MKPRHQLLAYLVTQVTPTSKKNNKHFKKSLKFSLLKSENNCRSQQFSWNVKTVLTGCSKTNSSDQKRTRKILLTRYHPFKSVLALPARAPSNLYYTVFFQLWKICKRKYMSFFPFREFKWGRKSCYWDRVVAQIFPLVQQWSRFSECTQCIQSLACTDSSCNISQCHSYLHSVHSQEPFGWSPCLFLFGRAKVMKQQWGSDIWRTATHEILCSLTGDTPGVLGLGIGTLRSTFIR